MKLLPDQCSASNVAPAALLKRLFSAAFLGLSLALPALAQKVEATMEARKEHPPNEAILGLFTVLNWIAGIAIVGTIVFSIIWFLQRKDDDDDLEDEAEEAQAEKIASEGEEAKAAEAPSEAAVEETKATEAPSEAAVDEAEAAKSEDVKPSEEEKKD